MYLKISTKITSNHYILMSKQSFIHPDFLLDTELAKRLYHETAKTLPIIDYHCHLDPKQIAENKKFDNAYEIWLAGDHYKWRALRAAGVDEAYITGDQSDREKFRKWAETVPQTLRNPLYHWTHLELARYFGITELLNGFNADRIYDEMNEKLKDDAFRVRALLQKMDVRVVCTTDDPADSLEHHEKLAADDDFEILVLPAFRPDRATDVRDPQPFNAYLDILESVSDQNISRLQDHLDVLEMRHSYFHSHGCRLSDHGLHKLPEHIYGPKKAKKAFTLIRSGDQLTKNQQEGLQGYLLFKLAKMDHKRGWVQQFHLGALRNNNTKMYNKLGADTGFDSIGDYPHAEALANLLDALNQSDQLAKTILYNVNPKDNAVFATMAGNYNEGHVRGKMQWGSAWWYLDQLDGMEDQMNILSNMGLLSTFIGMLTDSRSFLSYPRHEYFRRLLCRMIGHDAEQGLVPEDSDLLEDLVSKVCYHNAKHYFSFNSKNIDS